MAGALWVVAFLSVPSTVEVSLDYRTRIVGSPYPSCYIHIDLWLGRLITNHYCYGCYSLPISQWCTSCLPHRLFALFRVRVQSLPYRLVCRLTWRVSVPWWRVVLPYWFWLIRFLASFIIIYRFYHLSSCSILTTIIIQPLRQRTHWHGSRYNQTICHYHHAILFPIPHQHVCLE